MFDKVFSWPDIDMEDRFGIPTPKQEDKFLHGVNLTDWTFLGASKISFTFPVAEGDAKEYALVFHFVERTNSNNRQLVIPEQLSAPHIDFTKHEWYILVGSLWMAGQLPLYHGINYYISDHLKNYMALLHDHEWNPQTLQWQKITRNLFEGVTEVPQNNVGAKVNIVKPGSPIIHKSEPDANGVSKVITVNFGKKKDDKNGNEPDPSPTIA